MEQRFGYDFSRVRVHSGSAAEKSAREVNANAYTVGSDIVFSTGRFASGTQEGRRLIAHELTHVLQQSKADTILIGRSNEAHRICAVPSMTTIQRQPDTDNENDRPQYPPDFQHGAPTRPVAPDPHVAPDPNQQPEPPKQGPYRRDDLRDRLIKTLGIGLGIVAFVALVACFVTGVCEAGAILAAVGVGAFLVVVGILESLGVNISGRGPSA